jgi:hypothetical protein
MEEDRWKEVCSVSGMAHARLIEGRLGVEGIPTTLRYEAVGVVYAITIDGLGEVKILVPEEEWERAKLILAQPFEEKDLDWER